MKLLTSLLVLLLIITSMPVQAFAKEKDEYQKAFDKIIKKYDVDMILYDVEKDEITIEEFVKFIETEAKEQKELKDFMEQRKLDSVSADTLIPTLKHPIYTVTVAADPWCGWPENTWFDIVCTYVVDEPYIDRYTYLALRHTYAGVISGWAYSITSGPSVSWLDGNRTLGVSYTVKLSKIISYSKVLYAEFYA